MAKCAECVHNDVCVLWRKRTLYGIDRDLGCDKYFKSKVDFVEVVHGRWIKTEVGSNCSACGLNVMSWSGNDEGHEREKGICLMHYCPNCGALMMDGDEYENL